MHRCTGTSSRTWSLASQANCTMVTQKEVFVSGTSLTNQTSGNDQTWTVKAVSTFLPLNLFSFSPVHLCTGLPLYLCICVPVHLPTCLPVHLPTCLPVCLFATPGKPCHASIDFNVLGKPNPPPVSLPATILLAESCLSCESLGGVHQTGSRDSSGVEDLVDPHVFALASSSYCSLDRQRM